MKVFRLISSIKLSVILFVIFAVASGCATFIESKYNTPTAWALVYGSWWFALVQLALGINLFFAIFAYKMYNKLALFIFHISFLFILLGSALTRFYGFEGSLHIRQNEASSLISTRDKFLSLASEQNSVSKPLYLSLIGSNHTDLSIDGVQLSLEQTVPNAKEIYTPDPSGDAALVFNISSEQNSSQIVLDKEFGYVVLKDAALVYTGAKPDALLEASHLKRINVSTNSLQADMDIKLINTQNLETTTIKAGQKVELKAGQMIVWDEFKITAAQLLEHAKKGYESSDKAGQTMMKFIAKSANESKVIWLKEDARASFVLDGRKFMLSYGTKLMDLDFKVRLDEFKLERYAGSNSPKSYESFISIIKSDGSEQKAHIFMNNVLDYEGMRFFQSSYDQDLKGSILSINQDPGKAPTYIGYFLLGLGLLLNIFAKNSRFNQLARRAASLSAALVIAFGLNHSPAQADELENAINAASAKLAPISLAEHANKLALIGVKRYNQRVAPFGIEAADVLKKISHKSSFEGQDAVVFMINLMGDFDHFKDKKIVLVHNKEVAQMLGISGKFASFSDFFKDDQYKLTKVVNAAVRTPAQDRSSMQKDLLKIDERVNSLYFASLGGFFTAINENGQFLNPLDAKNPSGRAYLLALISGAKSGNFALADEILSRIESEQGVSFDKSKFNLETDFEKAGIFSKLIFAYLIFGLALFVLVLAEILRQKPARRLKQLLYAVNILIFIIMIAALAMRGYLAGHAPWSNSYESLLYIAATLNLAGMIFAKKSAISLALSSMLAGVVLFVAHLGSIDPQIGNLAPVLSSIWLSIHVSVITASYGFLGLCALLGLFSLLLFALARPSNAERIKASIKEACIINEMAMILGLSLLVMGNFLGGVWANESWGRYWGWDSKETWALVSILVYAALLHLRLIRWFNSQFVFSLLSLFAYYVIVMTYFGVNYFLTGMHSYAAGNAASVPLYAYFITGGLFALAILAARNSHLSETL